MISEEMSILQLAKRSLLFSSDLPQEHWQTSLRELREDCVWYDDHHAESYFVESCGTVANAEALIEHAASELEIKCVFIDYAQLLRAPGKSRYEQITNVSMALRNVTTSTGVVLVALCQMNGDIVKRKKFQPQLTDIKETGQLAQDADVVIFLAWPHRLDPSNPHNEYHIFIAKNRNRPLNEYFVKCRFEPSKQQFLSERASDKPNHSTEIAAYNSRETERKDLF